MTADNALSIVLLLCSQDPCLEDKIRWATTYTEGISWMLLAQDVSTSDLVAQVMPQVAMTMLCSPLESATAYLRMVIPQIQGRAVAILDKHTQCTPGTLAALHKTALTLGESKWLCGETLFKSRNSWQPLTASGKGRTDFGSFAATRPLLGGSIFQTEFLHHHLSRQQSETIWDDMVLLWHIFCNSDCGGCVPEVFALRYAPPPTLKLPQATPEQRIEDATKLLCASHNQLEICGLLDLWLTQIVKDGEAWTAKSQFLEMLHCTQTAHALDTEKVRDLALYADAMTYITNGLQLSPAENKLLVYLTQGTATITNFLPDSNDGLQRYLATSLKLAAVYEKALEHPERIRCAKFLFAFRELVQRHMCY